MTREATVFAPGSISNVGPGFDLLGLAIRGMGDRVRLRSTASTKNYVSVEVSGRDARNIPTDPDKNVAAIAAMTLLAQFQIHASMEISIEKGLPLAGGLGGSAASSVAGAVAASLAFGLKATPEQVLSAAMAAEIVVAGRHLDNVAPSLLGGFTLVRSLDPIDVVSLNVRGDWWIAVAIPDLRIETKAARAILPDSVPREQWIRQMANTAALVHAIESGDSELARRAFVDDFAEPVRAKLIPRFAEVKAAALQGGAIGCSISGSGPTVFALAESEAAAAGIATAMQQAFGTLKSETHVTSVDREGARAV